MGNDIKINSATDNISTKKANIVDYKKLKNNFWMVFYNNYKKVSQLMKML